MSHREFNAQRTMLANAMATAGAELLEYMGTAAALAAIPNTDPPRYVVAGTLAMIAKVLPSADAPAAATVLTDEVRAAMKRAYSLGQTYWQQADSEYTSQHKKADLTAGRFIELTDEICSKVERLAHAGVTAEPAGWKLVPVEATPEMYEANVASLLSGDNLRGTWAAMVAAAPAAIAQVPAAEVRAAALEEAAKLCESEVPCSCCFSDDEVALAANMAAAIRALAQQSTADKASEVRAAEDAEYELHQDDMMVAATSGKNAYAEIQHYANQYVQDGPVEIFKVVRTAIERRAIPRSRTADSAGTGAMGEGAEA